MRNHPQLESSGQETCICRSIGRGHHPLHRQFGLTETVPGCLFPSPAADSKPRHAQPDLPADPIPAAMPNPPWAPSQLHHPGLPAAGLPPLPRTHTRPPHPICLPGSSRHGCSVAVSAAKATVRILGKTPAVTFRMLWPVYPRGVAHPWG